MNRAAKLSSLWRTDVRVWSLWDVLKRYAESFYQLGNAIGYISSYLGEDPTPGAASPGKESEIKRAVAMDVAIACCDEVETACNALNLEFALRATERLRYVATKTQYREPSIQEIRAALNEVDHLVRDELAKRELFFVPADGAKFYNDPLKGWAGTITSFPSTVSDVEEASRSLALDRGTGAVFHCMRILQIGLASMARGIGASVNNPEDQNWHRVIENIHARLREVQPGQAKMHEMNEQDRRFFAEAALQFMYLKDAFRNYVTHGQIMYDAKGAESIYSHVRELMEHLATKLSG